MMQIFIGNVPLQIPDDTKKGVSGHLSQELI